MKILRHYLNAWKKTFDYSSRSTRAEYWSFGLITSILIIMFTVLPKLFNMDMQAQDPTVAAAVILTSFSIFFIATLLPSISVTVRRLHDIDFRGWWVLIQIIPFAGGLVMLIFALMDGTAGDNRFGADPKNRRPKKPQPQTEKNGD